MSEMNTVFFKVKVNNTVPLCDSADVTCQDAADYDEVDCVLALPESYRESGEPCPIILFGHGFSGYVTENRWRAQEENDSLVSFFVSRGFAVFDVDNTVKVRKGVTPQSGNADLGCPKLLESYLKAFSYIKKRWNVQQQVLIYSVSFGTFTAMNLMTRAPYMVKAACMTGCRFGVKVVFDREKGEHIQSIAKAFGFRDKSGAVYEADRVQGWDPYSEIHEENGIEVLRRQLPPVKAMVSTADTRELSEAIRALKALKNAGNDVQLRVVDGLTHTEICELQREGLREEVFLFFERFI